MSTTRWNRWPIPLASRDVNLIVPIWSSARSGHREEFGNMTKPQEDGLLKLIGEGRGIAGWHGHMGDAFRDRPTYHFLIGGQFVAHPPGWPDNLQPAEDYIDYDVTVTRPADPIMEGIRSFRLRSEQYYMLVDPSNEVLATTTFSGDHLWWIEGTVIPVVWKRRWDRGRVFYCSIGHELATSSNPRSRRSCGAGCAGRRAPRRRGHEPERGGDQTTGRGGVSMSRMNPMGQSGSRLCCRITRSVGVRRGSRGSSSDAGICIRGAIASISSASGRLVSGQNASSSSHSCAVSVSWVGGGTSEPGVTGRTTVLDRSRWL
jgi:type 1 glutamine amidotransferase